MWCAAGQNGSARLRQGNRVTPWHISHRAFIQLLLSAGASSALRPLHTSALPGTHSALIPPSETKPILPSGYDYDALAACETFNAAKKLASGKINYLDSCLVRDVEAMYRRVDSHVFPTTIATDCPSLLHFERLLGANRTSGKETEDRKRDKGEPYGEVTAEMNLHSL